MLSCRWPSPRIGPLDMESSAPPPRTARHRPALSLPGVRSTPESHTFQHARLSALGAALLFSLTLSACAMDTTSNFDSDAWKAQRGVAAQDNRRGGMVVALEQTLSIGMSRDDVVRLLGEPDSSDAASATDIYELGVAAYGIDEEFYEIRYENGKIASHRIGRR